ncbi:MAG TPA: pyridoxamine 5'-phosphate oxidase [Planctomycetaceae bacterium]|nr:pyridoxamine 5'-phosphate oxidase [Planctomycetaceae bacterium]
MITSPEHSSMELREEELDQNPFRQFENWFQAATDAGLHEPNAMSLATVSDKGAPSLRTVLLKVWDEKGFVFFTNHGSRKARDIAANPNVALLFYWAPLHRQVRIEGTAQKVSTLESLKYFITRPRGSQLGAWSSEQSSTISSRAILQAKLEEIKQKFQGGEVPLPSFWGGFRIIPSRFEFWQAGDDRLHDRFVYEPESDDTWSIQRLAP